MINIPARAMWTGKGLVDGETVTGYLVVTGHNEVTDKRGRYLRTEYCYQIQPSDYSHRVCVDPATVEPVVENVLTPTQHPYYLMGRCPNCNITVTASPDELTRGDCGYCKKCGQRLGWG